MQKKMTSLRTSFALASALFASTAAFAQAIPVSNEAELKTALELGLPWLPSQSTCHAFVEAAHSAAGSVATITICGFVYIFFIVINLL